jgi:glycosyltransferase involved in cell wall biosynthesis
MMPHTMKDDAPTVVCVLGMHRSGTSVTTWMLNVLGAYLGPANDLVPPAPDNPRGFWESRTIVELNSRILMRLGGHSLAPPVFPSGWHRAPWLADLRKQAAMHIHASYADAGLWAWKDPRSCLTLPFWQEVMPPMKYVICLRNPADVAQSLERRNRTPYDRGLYLWLLYTLGALQHTRMHPQNLVLFDHLIDDPTEELRKLASFVGAPERGDQPAVRNAVISFIDADLRHHRSDGAAQPPISIDKRRRESCAALAQRGYEIFERGNDGDWPEAQRALEEALHILSDDTTVGVSTTARAAGNAPLVSVIVNNFNHGQFLRDAVDSALMQTFPNVEVIVIDDGSTDDSREIIASYGDRVIALLKDNGGQAAAFNVGLAASKGEIVIFLNADDVLLPTAVQRVVGLFRSGVVKVHWPLWRVNPDLSRTGQRIPTEDLPVGDLRAATFAGGPATSLSPPTSGNAWARDFLEQVMPIPEENHRTGANDYLYGLAPAFGVIDRIKTPQALYRVHASKNDKHLPLEHRVALGLRCLEDQWSALRKHARHAGRAVDEASWERASYFHQLQAAINDLETLLPAKATLILMDEGRWAVGETLSGRTVIPFLERDGYYNGVPDNDQTAIRELERLRSERGASYLAIAWPAFWWINHFTAFAEHVRSRYTLLISNSQLVIFRLSV